MTQYATQDFARIRIKQITRREAAECTATEVLKKADHRSGNQRACGAVGCPCRLSSVVRGPLRTYNKKNRTIGEVANRATPQFPLTLYAT